MRHVSINIKRVYCMRFSKNLLVWALLFLSLAASLAADVPISENQHQRPEVPVILPLGYYTQAAAPTEFLAADKLMMFVFALLLSIIIETMVILALRKPLISNTVLTAKSALKYLWVCAVGTAATITIFWWVLPAIMLFWRDVIIAGEISAALAEAVWYGIAFKIRLRTAFMLSFAANLASLGLGILILNALGMW